MKIKNLKNYKIAILWFWKEGKSTLNFLKKVWVKNISILDKNNINLEENIWNIKIITGDSYLNKLWEYDYIFKSPWISPYNKKIEKYRDKLISWTEIFFDNYKWKSICVTWTKGKSTISTLIYKTLKKAWLKVKLVWNIWNPVLDEINLLNEKVYDFVVYEMSSYMLETLKPKSYISIINNIYDCHIDWHNWRKNYINAKKNIIINAENKIVNYELKNKISSKNIFYFGKKWNYKYSENNFFINEKKILEDKNILLKWEHNRYNISAVIWVLDIISKDRKKENLFFELKEVLKSFSWLAHRMENIWAKKWITFIDDAIAVTSESTIAAIKTFWENVDTIFLWWQDSWLDFSKLRKTLKDYNIKNIVLFPDSWNRIFLDFSNNLEFDKEVVLEWNYSPKLFKTKSMKKAVDFAFKNTTKGKICLLSCASPSFSLWSWFEEKWNLFKKEVETYV